MAQVTIRTDDDLVERLKRAARAAGMSMNAFVTATLDAATNPDLAGSDAQRTRERLARAGLLVDMPARSGDGPDPDAVRDAGRRAAIGRPLAELVAESR